MNVDINDLAHTLLDRIRGCHSDSSDVSDSADELVKLIRAVIFAEVQAASLEDPSIAEAKTVAMADAARQERWCPAMNTNGKRCSFYRGHEKSQNTSIRNHDFN